MTRLLLSVQFNATALDIGERRPDVATALGPVLTYLVEHGRQAAGPDVEWHIRTSRYQSHSGEIRWPDPQLQSEYPNDAWRGLFVAATDTRWILLTLLGNKAVGPHQGNAWYDQAVPVADQIAADYIAHHALDNAPTPSPED